MADALRRSGRLDEGARRMRARPCARAAGRSASRCPVVPGASARHTCGSGRCDAHGKPRRSLRRLERRCAHYDGGKPLSGEDSFFLACCHAGLAGLAGRPGSGVSAVERADQAEKAMAVLRQAVTRATATPMFTGPNRPSTRSGTGPTSGLLMMGLVFPTEPFARGVPTMPPGLGLPPPEPPPVGRGVDRPGTAAGPGALPA